jgi:hypothetical protein
VRNKGSGRTEDKGKVIGGADLSGSDGKVQREGVDIESARREKKINIYMYIYLLNSS